MLNAPSPRHLMSGNCMMKTLFRFLLFVLILWHDVLTSTKESRNWSSKKKNSWSRLTDKGFVLNKPGFLSEEQFTLPNSKWNTVLILTWILSLSVSTAIIPGGPGLAGTRIFPVWILLELRVLEMVGENWSYKMFKPPVKMSPPTNQYPTFYRPNALPVAKPTVSKQ